MRNHQLDDAQIQALLETQQVGHIATVNSDGSPYVLPVHFVYFDGKIFVHGLPKGQKIENIAADPRVSFCVEKMNGFILDKVPCNVNTAYQSVVIRGTARMLSDLSQKSQVLRHIVEKYTPTLSMSKVPEAAIRGTGVIEITVEEWTGKFFDVDSTP